jgi:hypothetical protein
VGIRENAFGWVNVKKCEKRATRAVGLVLLPGSAADYKRAVKHPRSIKSHNKLNAPSFPVLIGAAAGFSLAGDKGCRCFAQR